MLVLFPPATVPLTQPSPVQDAPEIIVAVGSQGNRPRPQVAFTDSSFEAGAAGASETSTLTPETPPLLDRTWPNPVLDPNAKPSHNSSPSPDRNPDPDPSFNPDADPNLNPDTDDEI